MKTKAEIRRKSGNRKDHLLINWILYKNFKKFNQNMQWLGTQLLKRLLNINASLGHVYCILYTYTVYLLLLVEVSWGYLTSQQKKLAARSDIGSITVPLSRTIENLLKEASYSIHLPLYRIGKPWHGLKGQCHEIFDFRFFSMNQFPPSPWVSH